MNNEATPTSEFQAQLSETIKALSARTITPEQAKAIAAIVQQLNASLFIEFKTKRGY